MPNSNLEECRAYIDGRLDAIVDFLKSHEEKDHEHFDRILKALHASSESEQRREEMVDNLLALVKGIHDRMK